MNEKDGTGNMMYSARLGDPGELEGQRVAHGNLLTRILSELRSKQPKDGPQHYLLLGLSGMGKTTLLHQLAIAVYDDNELARQWLTLTLPEEQYNVVCLTQFWLNCVNSLADSLGQMGHTTEVDALDSRIACLPEKSAKLVLGLLLDEVRKRNKRVLLLIDNIHLVLNRLNDEQQAFFNTLQFEPEILIIGTSTYGIKENHQNKNSLYNLFQVIELKGMGKVYVRATLKHLAELNHNPNVIAWLDKNPDRIKAIHSLAGGNPGTTVLLYNLIDSELKGDLHDNLERLLDQITPWYKARMEDLSAQDQTIVDVLAMNWKPMSQTEITEKLSEATDEYAVELRRLEQQAVVERIQPPQGTTPVFQIYERFFNLWYLMRSNRRVQQKPAWRVCFLRMFFSTNELQAQAREQVSVPPLNLRDAEYTFALAQSVDSLPLRNALEHKVLQTLVEEKASAQEIHRLIDLKWQHPQLKSKLVGIKQLAKIRRKVSQALAETDIMVDSFCQYLLGSPSLNKERKQIIAEQAPTFTKKKWATLNRSLFDEEKQWRQMIGSHTVTLYRAIGSGEMAELSDTDGAEATAVRWDDPVLAAISWNAWIDSADTPSEQQIEGIEQIFRQAINFDPKLAILWYYLGNLLQFHQNRFDEAEQVYRRAIEIDQDFAGAWNQLGYLLKNHLSRFDEAEQAYRKSIGIDPSNPTAYNNLAWFLYEHRRQPKEAINLANRAFELDPNDLSSIHTLATLLVSDGNWKKALPFIQSFIEKVSGNFDSLVSADTLILFREIVSANKVQEGIDILVKTGVTEPCFSLLEAMKAITSTNLGYLESIDSERSKSVEDIKNFLIDHNPKP